MLSYNVSTCFKSFAFRRIVEQNSTLIHALLKWHPWMSLCQSYQLTHTRKKLHYIKKENLRYICFTKSFIHCDCTNGFANIYSKREKSLFGSKITIFILLLCIFTSLLECNRIVNCYQNLFTESTWYTQLFFNMNICNNHFIFSEHDIFSLEVLWILML